MQQNGCLGVKPGTASALDILFAPPGSLFTLMQGDVLQPEALLSSER